MKVAAIAAGLAVLVVTGCTASAADIGARVREGLEGVEGLTTAQKNAISQAIVTGLEGNLGIDWGLIGQHALTAIGSIFGVNVLRNRARKKRGEPVGTEPLAKS